MFIHGVPGNWRVVIVAKLDGMSLSCGFYKMTTGITSVLVTGAAACFTVKMTVDSEKAATRDSDGNEYYQSAASRWADPFLSSVHQSVQCTARVNLLDSDKRQMKSRMAIDFLDRRRI